LLKRVADADFLQLKSQETAAHYIVLDLTRHVAKQTSAKQFKRCGVFETPAISIIHPLRLSSFSPLRYPPEIHIKTRPSNIQSHPTMRLSTLLLPLLSVPVFAGFSISYSDSNQALLDTHTTSSFEVPGKNPLTVCHFT
jgi:hypothetical protein